MVCPPIWELFHSLKLVDYIHVQADKPWYNYYVAFYFVLVLMFLTGWECGFQMFISLAGICFLSVFTSLTVITEVLPSCCKYNQTNVRVHLKDNHTCKKEVMHVYTVLIC